LAGSVPLYFIDIAEAHLNMTVSRTKKKRAKPSFFNRSSNGIQTGVGPGSGGAGFFWQGLPQHFGLQKPPEIFSNCERSICFICYSCMNK